MVVGTFRTFFASTLVIEILAIHCWMDINMQVRALIFVAFTEFTEVRASLSRAHCFRSIRCLKGIALIFLRSLPSPPCPLVRILGTLICVSGHFLHIFTYRHVVT